MTPEIDISHPDYDIVKCVKQCSCCKGIVDRFIVKGTFGQIHNHVDGQNMPVPFQCRDCFAIGDGFNGIMTPVEKP